MVLTKFFLASALLIGSTLGASSSGDPLCSIKTPSLVRAASQYPTLTTAINEVLKHPIATWYTDGESADVTRNKLNQILSECSSNTRVTLVVYGLPNKDCEAGFSGGGSNKNAGDYRNWIQTLANTVGQRKVLYVLEPDAVGLIANGGCALNNGYSENLRTALQILSQNPNADIYLDVGFWTLQSSSGAANIAKTVKSLTTVGRLKGIALNTSNYRSNRQMADLCTAFQNAYGSRALNCMVDTSRNYNQSPPSTEWCNARFGGIGQLPTTNTGFSNIDYFVWVKLIGESDGTCDSSSQTADAMRGPPAGQFFKDGFVKLWNQGVFVKERGMAPVSA